MNFVNYPRTSILKNTYEGLVLKHRYAGFPLMKLQAWQPLTVIEEDYSIDIFLWILRNFYESFFAEHLLATTSRMMLFLILFS